MKQKIISLLILTTFLLFIPLVFSQPLNETPEGFWRFEEGSGLNATDSSGNNNHGDITGADYFASKGTNATGNYSLDFNGVDEFVFISDANDVFQFGDGSDDDPFTMMAWINLDDTTTFRIVFKNSIENEFIWGFTGADKFLLWLQDDSTAGYLRGDSVTNMATYEGTWIHIATTYDGTEADEGIQHYLNGETMSMNYLGSGSYTAMENTGEDSTVAYDGAVNYGDGRIDELVVIKKELTQGQIQQAMNYGWNFTTTTTTTTSTTTTTTIPTGILLELISPPDNSVNTDGLVDFLYNTNVSSNISLYIDGIVNSTHESTVGINTFENIIFLQNGSADWYVFAEHCNTTSEEWTLNLNLTYLYTDVPVPVDPFELGTCPLTELTSLLMFLFFILLGFIVIGVGWIFRNGLIGFIGGLMILSMGVYTYACITFMSVLIMGLGVLLMVLFIFKGSRGFN